MIVLLVVNGLVGHGGDPARLQSRREANTERRTMKTRILIAMVVVAATFVWQAAAQYVAKKITGGHVGIADNPLRMAVGSAQEVSRGWH